MLAAFGMVMQLGWLVLVGGLMWGAMRYYRVAPAVTAGDLARRLGLALVQGAPSTDLSGAALAARNHHVVMRGEVAGREAELVHRSEFDRGAPWRLFGGGRRVRWSSEVRLSVRVASTAQIEVIHRAGVQLATRRITQPRVPLVDALLDRSVDAYAAEPGLAAWVAPELAPLVSLPFAHLVVDRGHAWIEEAAGGATIAIQGEALLALLVRVAQRIESYGSAEVADEGATIPMHAMLGLERGMAYRGAMPKELDAPPPATPARDAAVGIASADDEWGPYLRMLPPIPQGIREVLAPLGAWLAPAHTEVEHTELGRVVDVLRAPLFGGLGPIAIGALCACVFGAAAVQDAARALHSGAPWLAAPWHHSWWVAPLGLACVALATGAGSMFTLAQRLSTRVVLRQHGFDWYDLGRPVKLRYGDVSRAVLVQRRHGGRHLWIALATGADYSIHHVAGLSHLQAAIDRARRG